MSTTSLPYVINMKLHQNASFSRKVIWKKRSDGTPAIDLDDFNAKMTIKPQSPNRGPVITLTNDNLGLVLDAVEGSVTIILTSEQTGQLIQHASMAHYGSYDLLLTPKVGTEPVYCLIRGSVEVTPGVTEP